MLRRWPICGVLVLLIAGCSSETKPPQTTPPKPLSQEEILDIWQKRRPSNEEELLASKLTPTQAALRTALNQLEQGGSDSRAFQQALQAVAADLPEFKVSIADGSPVWNQAVLNESGLRFDAFRFRSPLDRPADLHWVFSLPDKNVNWYILPVEGEMMGFDNYEHEWNLIAKGTELPKQNWTVFQDLRGGQIEPGREYIIWFKSSYQIPHPITCALRLSPAGSFPYEPLKDSVAQAVGFKYDYRVYEPTPEGLEEALIAAYSITQNGGSDSVARLRALQSVASALPELELSSGKAVWNRLPASGSSVPFVACRFKSPLDVAADLHWVHVLAGDFLIWGMMPIDPLEYAAPVADLTYRPELNLKLEDHTLPPDNTAVFQSVPGGHILPGHEYILWFTPLEGSLPDIELALHLSPAGSIPPANTSKAIADAIAVDIPAIPDADRVAATLARCRQLYDARKVDLRFFRLIQSVAAGLPEVQLTSDGSPAVWNRISLNENGPSLTAFQFRSPLDVPATLEWAFVRPFGRRMVWRFLAADSDVVAPPSQLHTERNLQLDGLNLPDDNEAGFESIPGGLIGPGQSWILWLVPDGDAPLDLQVAVNLRAASSDYETTSARAIAGRLGISLPTAPAVAGSRVLEGHTDKSFAVCYTPDSRILYSAGGDGVIRVWDSQTGEALAPLAEQLGRVRMLVMSRNGQVLAAAKEDPPTVYVWDLTSKQLTRTLNPEPGILRTLKISEDGSRLAVAFGQSDDGTADNTLVSVWNLEEGDEPLLIPLDNFRMGEILFTPDGERLVAAGMRADWRGQYVLTRGIIQIWNAATGEQVGEVPDTTDGYRDADLFRSEDGLRLVTSSDNGTLMIYDLERKAVVTGLAQEAQLHSISAAADGKLIALAGLDGIRLWDVQLGRIVRRWPGHREGTISVTLSPDGRQVASTGVDTTVRLWDSAYTDPALPKTPEQPIVNSLGMKLMPIPAGKFLMGAEPNYEQPQNYDRSVEDERPQHPVTISRPFYMAQHEVTVEQFRTFVEETGYQTSAEKNGGGFHLGAPEVGFEKRAEWTWRSPGFEQEDRHPVLTVSWNDAVAFCEWLSKKEDAVYRLPTEAEWEYACRAGSTTYWSTGNTPIMVSTAANVADAAIRAQIKEYETAAWWNDGVAWSAPVGNDLPNAFGLCDIHGNVFEWCSDWYNAVYYNFTPEVDPLGPETGLTKVVRGGSFCHSVLESRSAARNDDKPDEGYSCTGFRVVRNVE